MDGQERLNKLDSAFLKHVHIIADIFGVAGYDWAVVKIIRPRVEVVRLARIENLLQAAFD